MKETFPHLHLIRETPVRKKRARQANPSKLTPKDVCEHGQGLLRKLAEAKEQASANVGGFDERRLLSFSVDKNFNPEDLQKISKDIEVVSQESETLVIGFASNESLSQFEARFATMAKGNDGTYNQVIYALHSINSWSSEDRKGWALKKQGFPESEDFLIDVELWPLEGNHKERALEWIKFEEWLKQEAIEKKDQIKKPELTLYRVLCNATQANLLLRHRDVRTIDLPPSFGLDRSTFYQDVMSFSDIADPGIDAPRIAVLDSGIAAGHPLLKAAIAEAQSFLPENGTHDENGHGTLVAGLALYGDFERCLVAGTFSPTLRLLSGRILDKDAMNSTGFIENHIDEAVRYFAKKHKCRVFNLSICDQNKPYLGGHLKGLSVTLDTLSRELGILFVVSAGNHRVGENSPEGLALKDKYPGYLLEEAWRILEPAPALNVLTVGSIARHNRSWNSQKYEYDPSEIPIAKPEQPSPFTLGGYSIDRAIKPELLAHGGNWVINTRANYSLLPPDGGISVVSTGHQFAMGRPFAFSTGTSMAAPQVAHLAASILREYPNANANFIRALLCLNAFMPEESQKLIDSDKSFRSVCGYGQVRDVSLHRSLESAVTLISEDSIENKQHHFYEIPIPDIFTSGGKCLREIAIALAYTPPVRSTRIKYRATRINFRLVSAPNLEHITTMFNKETEKNLYKRLPELNKSTIGFEARSKGTVQADLWHFLLFNANAILKKKKLFVVVTRNDFPWGEHICDTLENYSLLVSLRDQKNETARLYSTIKAQLEARQKIKVKL